MKFANLFQDINLWKSWKSLSNVKFQSYLKVSYLNCFDCDDRSTPDQKYCVMFYAHIQRDLHP